jgi:hypothetical protein
MGSEEQQARGSEKKYLRMSPKVFGEAEWHHGKTMTLDLERHRF